MTFAHVYSDIKPKRINKKMYRSAMRSIWSMLAEEKRLIVVNELNIDEPVKSSQVKNILADLGLNTALFVLSANNDNFCLLYTSPSPRDATLSRMPSSA